MNNDAINIVQECTTRSDNSTIAFPDVVKKLMAAGVESYHADIVRAEKTYYMPNGESVVTKAHEVDGVAPATFSADGVAAAVKAIQRGEINYAAFCERIVAAGCVGYVVSLAGQRAIYSGRSGDCYVERIPTGCVKRSRRN